MMRRAINLHANITSLGKLDISFQPRSTGGKVVENAALSITLPEAVSSVKLNANAGQYTFDQITKVRLLCF